MAELKAGTPAEFSRRQGESEDSSRERQEKVLCDAFISSLMIPKERILGSIVLFKVGKAGIGHYRVVRRRPLLIQHLAAPSSAKASPKQIENLTETDILQQREAFQPWLQAQWAQVVSQWLSHAI